MWAILMSALAIYYYSSNNNYSKILKSDWLSTVLISALTGQFKRKVRAITRALKWLFFTASKKNLGISCVLIKKEPNISQILLKLWLIGNRTEWSPIRSVIILVIKQIGLPLCGRSILLLSRNIHTIFCLKISYNF